MESLNIPVILGTTRKGRRSVHAARFVTAELSRRPGVVTELVDIASMPIRTDGAGEEIKDPAFAGKMENADGLVIVAPEYNHSFPGLLKHVLDTCLEEYIHKAVGIVGVSAGPFGGTRVVESFLPVLRELGLVTTFTDLNFTKAGEAFDERGEVRDRELWSRRTALFLDELIWMSTVLRYGRENVPQE
jgi:NAD(P)H-dependent FMN reductase